MEPTHTNLQNRISSKTGSNNGATNLRLYCVSFKVYAGDYIFEKMTRAFFLCIECCLRKYKDTDMRREKENLLRIPRMENPLRKLQCIEGSRGIYIL